MEMSDVVIVWDEPEKGTVLADFDDHTVRSRVLEKGKGEVGILWLSSIKAWELHPPAAGIVWSPKAVAVLARDLEEAGEAHQVNAVFRRYKKFSSARRFSKLRLHMANKIMGRKRK
jgi:hypothetical protein